MHSFTDESLPITAASDEYKYDTYLKLSDAICVRVEALPFSTYED